MVFNFPRKLETDFRYNCMTKTYRDGSKQIICATHRVFREPGWESCELATQNSYRNTMDSIDESVSEVVERSVWELEAMEEADRKRLQENVSRSMRRARVRVRDYCLCTDMRWFATFTLDRSKVDRYDVVSITKKLNHWLNHQQQRRGISYVMVPEFHKDGAVHFHGMLTEGLEAVDSGTVIPPGEDRPKRPRSAQQRAAWLKHGGRVVYNLPGWPYGFTTALALDGCYEKAVNYVCKYISKGIDWNDGVPSKVGGRWYYHGGELGRPEVEYDNLNLDDLRNFAGECAHEIDLKDNLPGVEMVVVWVQADGVLR